MEDTDYRDLASAWWMSDGGSDAFESVERMVLDKSPNLPAFIRAAVETVPAGKKIAYIGTSILESLQILDEAAGVPDTTIEVLQATGLEAAEMIEVLAGIYPGTLEQLDIAGRLAEVLPADRIAWLLDDDAPGRHEYL